MPSGKPTRISDSGSNTNPLTLQSFDFPEPDATLHDRDGKTYDAVILRETTGANKKGQVRVYGELRYRLRPNEWVDTTAVSKNTGDIQGRKWYEKKPGHLSGAEVAKELAQIKARQDELLKASGQDKPVEPDTGTTSEKVQSVDVVNPSEDPSDIDDDGDDDGDDDADVDLENMNKASLLQYAKSAGIMADKRWGIAKLIDEIKKTEI